MRIVHLKVNGTCRKYQGMKKVKLKQDANNKMTKCIIEMEYGYKTYSYSDIKGVVLISIPLGILSS